jgi:hypothetical protein
MRKIGWALVDESGRPAGQGILPLGQWAEELGRSLPLDEIRAVVLGDGTNRMNIEQAIGRLLPQTPVATVNEAESTVEAWRLKKREVAGGNLLKQLWFSLDQLLNSGNVDDYAARVLALRYLAARRED